MLSALVIDAAPDRIKLFHLAQTAKVFEHATEQLFMLILNSQDLSVKFAIVDVGVVRPPHDLKWRIQPRLLAWYSVQAENLKPHRCEVLRVDD